VLEEMRIRGLGVISEATLELAEGLTVVTGETGAGKTMVVTGLQLLLGGRADSGAVRAGASAAVVEGAFRVSATGPVAERAREAGAELEELPADGGSAGEDQPVELLVARTVSAGGRSRAHLGGRTVPVGVLAELADDLVALHGQSEQLLLRSAARQREVVDTFAGSKVAKLLGEYRTRFARRQEVAALLTDITTRARERAQEADALRVGLEELERIDPKPGEDVAIAEELERLSNVEDLRLAAGAAHRVLVADELTADAPADAAGLVDSARKQLDGVASHDPQLQTLATRLAEVGYTLVDVAGELSEYLSNLDADPARLEHLMARRADLVALQRKYGEDVASVLEWGRQAALRLHDLEDADERVDELRSELARLDAELEELAGRLHDARVAAGKNLAKQVGKELAELAMPHAALVVRVERATELASHGGDEVSLLLAPHAGAEPRPLGKGASGGELSRVMLALEVVLAGSDAVPTFVFDEVDAGVGGKAAVEIGRRLAALARRAQVIVVTHLPQVAAFADRHLVVVKSDDGRITSSGVHQLEDSERVRELARMLAGQEDSTSAQAHAEELLAAAHADRRG
jgi:DNA repair protein RecN (Recombination protein N)